jgi:two-component system, response regulator / RNA-binding antiterminator
MPTFPAPANAPDPMPSACVPLRDNHAAVFRSWQTPALVMDTDLVLCDANPAYLAVTNRTLDDLTGRHLFDAFPPNPDADADAVVILYESLQRVITTREPDHLGVQRYDVPWEGPEGGFVERYWAPSNTPILDDDGELLGILHAVEDVTEYQEDLHAAIEFYRAEVSAQGESCEAYRMRFAEYLRATVSSARSHATIAEEVEGLRAALGSRAVIDQAKGILMATRRCGADEAFDLLVHASQTRNVKLRTVAEDLVERTAAGRSAVNQTPSSAEPA